MELKIVEETLSDGSKVYNLVGWTEPDHQTITIAVDEYSSALVFRELFKKHCSWIEVKGD